MGDLAAVNAVLQHQIESATVYRLTTIRNAVGPNPSFTPDPRTGKFIVQIANRFEHEIATVDIDDSTGLVFVDDELAVFHVVSERWHATHPHALLFRGGDLIPHTLANDLALKLGEGQQHIEREPSHAGRGVELLRDRHERHAATVENLHEIGERSRQSVNLVDDDYIDLICLDVGQQALQRRPLHRTAGISTVIILGWQDRPALVFL